MKQVEKQLGRTPQELNDAPKLDERVSYLFDMFLQIKTAYNVKISYQDLQAFESMTGIELSAFDVDTLKALDNTHWSVINGD